ncbi:hypothetical protein [Faecalibacterium sp. OF04-11AC]|uniref:hypothetical protein n=1 Tax=Faecalibacterium sp. OF04-11AC TaxID=2293109 RepID=UPI000FE2576B|nr:hypothetical protein [Faecalibacterium sp. OF04-11AC]
MAYKKCPGYMENGICSGNGQACHATEEGIQTWFDETFKSCNLIDTCQNRSFFGNSFFVITDEDIEALKHGKVLFARWKYGLFLKYDGGAFDEHNS